MLQLSPPEYNLDHFGVNKTVLFWSPVDELSSGKDMETLLNKLKHVKVYKVDNFRHFDFLLSLNATEHIYAVIVNILKNETFLN